MDISEQCGYSLAQQAALFTSVKPLFANKPVLIVCNKTDARKMDDLKEEELDILKKLAQEAMDLGSGGKFLYCIPVVIVCPIKKQKKCMVYAWMSHVGKKPVLQQSTLKLLSYLI